MLLQRAEALARGFEREHAVDAGVTAGRVGAGELRADLASRCGSRGRSPSRGCDGLCVRDGLLLLRRTVLAARRKLGTLLVGGLVGERLHAGGRAGACGGRRGKHRPFTVRRLANTHKDLFSSVR